jgi:hypothetical protein
MGSNSWPPRPKSPRPSNSRPHTRDLKIRDQIFSQHNADHLCSMNDGFYFVKKLKVDEFVPKYDIPNPSESLFLIFSILTRVKVIISWTGKWLKVYIKPFKSFLI